jgi:hypothetical protein
VTIPTRITLHIGYMAPTLSSPPHLKHLQEVAPFYFVCVYEVYQPHSLIFIHLPLLTSPPHTYIVPVSQSCLSILIPKSVFKGVSQCIPVHTCCSPLLLFSLTPAFLPPLFNNFQYILLCLLPAQV